MQRPRSGSLDFFQYPSDRDSPKSGEDLRRGSYFSVSGVPSSGPYGNGQSTNDGRTSTTSSEIDPACASRLSHDIKFSQYFGNETDSQFWSGESTISNSDMPKTKNTRSYSSSSGGSHDQRDIPPSRSSSIASTSASEYTSCDISSYSTQVDVNTVVDSRESINSIDSLSKMDTQSIDDNRVAPSVPRVPEHISNKETPQVDSPTDRVDTPTDRWKSTSLQSIEKEEPSSDNSHGLSKSLVTVVPHHFQRTKKVSRLQCPECKKGFSQFANDAEKCLGKFKLGILKGIVSS